jgi:hypothetical protein
MNMTPPSITSSGGAFGYEARPSAPQAQDQARDTFDSNALVHLPAQLNHSGGTALISTTGGGGFNRPYPPLARGLLARSKITSCR